MSGTNVKYQHVLPFIANFPAVAGRIEQLLERWPPEDGQQAQQMQQQQVHSTPPATASARPAQPSSGRPPLPPSAAGRPPLVPSPFQSSPGSSRQTPGWRGPAESSASEVSSMPLSSETEEVSEISFMETEDEASSRRTTDASAESSAAGAAAAVAAGTALAAQQAAGAARQAPAVPGPGDVLR